MISEESCDTEDWSNDAENTNDALHLHGTFQFWLQYASVLGHQKQPGYKLSSKYLPLCSAKQIN